MEVDIFLITEEGKKYSLDVPQKTYYKYLKDILIDKIFGYDDFQIAFGGKTYTKNNENDVVNFNQGDIICSMMSGDTHVVEFHPSLILDEEDKNLVELSGILQICLL